MEYDSLTTHLDGGINDSLLLAFRDSMAGTSIGQIDSLLGCMELHIVKGAGPNLADSLTDALENITPEDSIEHYMKEMGLLALKRTAVDDTAFSQAEVSDLKELAVKCPYEYGPGVYMARLMLLQVDSLPKIYQNECEAYFPFAESSKRDGAPPQVEQEDPERKILVYPNPAKNAIFIEAPLGEGEKGTFELWGITGNKIGTYSIDSKKIRVSLADFSAGLYYYNININGERMHSGKQIIVK